MDLKQIQSLQDKMNDDINRIREEIKKSDIYKLKKLHDKKQYHREYYNKIRKYNKKSLNENPEPILILKPKFSELIIKQITDPKELIVEF